MYIHFFFLFYYIHNSLADCECKSVNTLWNGTWVIIEGKDLHLYLVGGYQNLLKKRERERTVPYTSCMNVHLLRFENQIKHVMDAGD